MVAGARSALFLPYAQARARSSSTRSTRPPTSRRTASTTTPATWRWCAAASRARRSCWPRRRPRSRRGSTSSAGATATCACPSASAAARLPQIRAIDLKREEIAERPLAVADASPSRCEETLERGEQALLFLNRRGYAPLTLCRACAHRYECPNCSAWLVEHRFRRALVCHHCGHVERTPAGLRRMRQPSIRSSPAGPASSASPRRWPSAFPASARSCSSSDFPGGTERLRQELAAIAAGEFDIVDRHAARRQGAQFPAADPGRRPRRRYRPRPRAIRARPSGPSSCCSR